MIEGKTQLKATSTTFTKQMAEFVDELAQLVFRDKIVVDEYTTDQLLVYMALAKGKSVIHTGELSAKSKHTLTQIAIINQFLP